MTLEEGYETLRAAYKNKGIISPSKFKKCRQLLFRPWLIQLKSFDYQVGKIYHDAIWSIKVLSKRKYQILQVRNPISGKAMWTA